MILLSICILVGNSPSIGSRSSVGSGMALQVICLVYFYNFVSFGLEMSVFSCWLYFYFSFGFSLAVGVLSFFFSLDQKLQL